MYPASHDANQAMKMKAEEADPVRIRIQEIKAEPEVSCMFLYVTCYVDNHKYAEMPVVFLILICLALYLCT
jgi:hypothetical protein